MKTTATNKKVRELISLVNSERIIPRPEFQRRLVWTRADKNHFLDSVLRGYPFPEIYLADGDVDLETGEGTQLLVDGLQRVSTLIQYFKGDPDLKLTTVPAYKELTKSEKESFLGYDVAVRDLASITREQIVEVFKRINATKYSLREIEINNALYDGSLKKFGEALASDKFFVEHNIFTSADVKRMGDLRYALGITLSLLGGYSNRDDAFGDYLDRYNDDFPQAEEISERLRKTFDFIEECAFPPESRIWRKADLFTAIVELDRIINVDQVDVQPSGVVDRLSSFFAAIDTAEVSSSTLPGIYYKAAVQASNDRGNRVRRGLILSGIVLDVPEGEILEELRGPADLVSAELDLGSED